MQRTRSGNDHSIYFRIPNNFFQRSGLEGRIQLEPDELRVTAKLGFLLSAMKGPIESEIRRVLAERLGS